jgi:hypothetical protein
MPTLEDVDLEELNERVKRRIEQSVKQTHLLFLVLSFVAAAFFGFLALRSEGLGQGYWVQALLSALAFHFASWVTTRDSVKKQAHSQILSQELSANIQELMRDSQDKRKNSTTRLEDGDIVILEKDKSETHKKSS